MKEFRNLEASEIECRVQQVAKDNTWCTLLLYKDARVDMNMLDEVYGATNWQRTHSLIGDQLFCTVSIWDDEKKCWVNKQDVGVESYTEATKGRASDAFKRACFNIGIGRELYTAPSIFIRLSKSDLNSSQKIKNNLFHVKSVGYNEKDEINVLVIVDSSGVIRFSFGSKEKVTVQQNIKTDLKPNVISDALMQALDSIKQARCIDELSSIYKELTAFHENQVFMGALSTRKKELK